MQNASDMYFIIVHTSIAKNNITLSILIFLNKIQFLCRLTLKLQTCLFNIFLWSFVPFLCFALTYFLCVSFCKDGEILALPKSATSKAVQRKVTTRQSWLLIPPPLTSALTKPSVSAKLCFTVKGLCVFNFHHCVVHSLRAIVIIFAMIISTWA